VDIDHTISATQLARTLSDVLNRVYYCGERFLVERNGQPLASLSPTGPIAAIPVEEWACRLENVGLPGDAIAEDLYEIQSQQNGGKMPGTDRDDDVRIGTETSTHFDLGMWSSCTICSLPQPQRIRWMCLPKCVLRALHARSHLLDLGRYSVSAPIQRPNPPGQRFSSFVRVPEGFHFLSMLTVLTLAVTLGGCTGLQTFLEGAGRASGAAAGQHATVDVAIPPDTTEARNLGTSFLQEQYYFKAKAIGEHLRQIEPGLVANVALDARAAQGLGFFDEALDSFAKAQTLSGSNGGFEHEILWLLTLRGDGLERLERLRQEMGLDEFTVGMLRRSIEKTNTETEAAAVGGGDEVITSRISDTYKVMWKVNGTKARLQFSTFGSGLSLSEDFAARVNLSGLKGERSEASRGAAPTTTVELDIDGKVVKDVRTFILSDSTFSLMSDGYDGVVTPDVLEGYSYQIDRKNETLVFFPPGSELPEPNVGATILPIFEVQGTSIIDVGLRNRTTDQVFPSKMIVNTGFDTTVFSLDMLKRFPVLEIQTTDTSRSSGTRGYSTKVCVQFAELEIGDRAWTGEFHAGSVPTFGPFTPFGVLGQDALREYRMTFDKEKLQLTLEAYRATGDRLFRAGGL